MKFFTAIEYDFNRKANWQCSPFKEGAQTILFKDPVRTAL
jgi:hypothetical protein